MKTPRLTDFDPDAKVPTLKSSLDSMPAIVKPRPVLPSQPAEKKQPSSAQETTSPLPQVSKTTNKQLTKEDKFEKYSTYLRPGYKKEIQLLALEDDCKDYEVLDQAITSYLQTRKKK